MRTHVRQALEDADHPEHWEMPTSFSWAEEMAQVRALIPQLEAIAGRKLHIDDQVQDAAYFASVDWPADDLGLRSTSDVHEPHCVIRFSAFGRLATFYVLHTDESLDGALTSRVEALLESAGYTCVWLDELHAPYTGQNKFSAEIDTWWRRFFDYC